MQKKPVTENNNSITDVLRQEFERIKSAVDNGYLPCDPGALHRKKYNGYMYLDRYGSSYAGDQIFIKNRIRVHYKKGQMVSPGGRYAFMFCRVRKEDSKLFEACLAQLHTILSKEDGYNEVLDTVLKGIVSDKEFETQENTNPK